MTRQVTGGDVRPPAADFDVLVVGAGPSGLMAACELLRRGVRVRVIDRAPEPVRAPKALSLWPRALDILEDVGLYEEIRRNSNRIDAFSYFSDRRLLASFGFSEDLASRILPQYETEQALTGQLERLGGKPERGVRLLALDDVDHSGDIEATDGVTAVLEHSDGEWNASGRRSSSAPTERAAPCAARSASASTAARTRWPSRWSTPGSRATFRRTRSATTSPRRGRW